MLAIQKREPQSSRRLKPKETEAETQRRLSRPKVVIKRQGNLIAAREEQVKQMYKSRPPSLVYVPLKVRQQIEACNRRESCS